jgi:hypothetical protein
MIKNHANDTGGGLADRMNASGLGPRMVQPAREQGIRDGAVYPYVKSHDRFPVEVETSLMGVVSLVKSNDGGGRVDLLEHLGMPHQ